MRLAFRVSSLALLCAAVVSLGDSRGTVIRTEWYELLASDGQDHDWFGMAVSISGDTVVVGAPNEDTNGLDSGAAYVYVRHGKAWTEQARLLVSDGAAGDHLGTNVSIDGDTVILGAPFADENGPDSGAAYVFVRDGTIWTQQKKLLANDGSDGDLFGYDVSISGNTGVLGAHYDDDNGFDSGSAYVFVRSGGTWTNQAKLLPRDGEAFDRFGADVSVDRDTAVIGAAWKSVNGVSSGAVYIYERFGTLWLQKAQLFASDGASGNQFGCDVSIFHDTVLIGAYGDKDNGAQSGASYVFVRDSRAWDTAWRQQAKLLASDGLESDYFGVAVSIGGDAAAIGAPFVDDNGEFSGAAYLFLRSGEVWTERAKLHARDGAFNDLFGHAVSVAGGTAIIGAPRVQNNGPDSGAAYVFYFGPIFTDGFEFGDTSAWSNTVE